jgi:hypothetical protein
MFVFVISMLLSISLSFPTEDFIKNYPTSFTTNNRVLGMVLTFNLVHIDPLIMILNEYVSMCEGGWEPTIVIFTVVNWSQQLRRLMRQKVYCYRTQSFIPIITSVHDSNVGTGLGAQHRVYMAEHLDSFDVFIYHEDDIVVKFGHLIAYLQETKTLHTIAPENGLHSSLIGFQRYRRLFKGDGHSPYGEQDVIEQELLEEMPDFHPVCISDKPYLHVHGNIHQAMWILTKSQVSMLQEKCSFLNQSSASR